MLKKKIYLNSGFFYTLFVFAIAYSMSSPILIEISARTGASIGRMGYIFSFYFAGFIIGCYLSSSLVKYFKRKTLLLIFTFVLSLSVGSLYFVMNYFYFVSAFFLIGLSGGFLESQVSILTIEINREKEALFVNMSQLFFGIGAFTGPLLPVFAIKYGIDWKYSYLVAAALGIANFIFMSFIDLSAFDNNTLKKKKSITRDISIPTRLKNKPFIVLLILVMFFYSCTETGLATWIPTFLRLDRSFSEIMAGQVFSFFWFAAIAGRIVTGFLSKRINILKLLNAVIFLTIISLVAGIYTKNNVLIIISFILAGLFMSGIWPLAVTAGGLKFPDKKNFVISIIILCGGIGGLTAPWFLSYILENSSLFMAMNAVYLFLAFSLAASAILYFLDFRSSRVNDSVKHLS